MLRAAVTQHASQSAQVMVTALPETKISSLARTAHAQTMAGIRATCCFT